MKKNQNVRLTKEFKFEMAHALNRYDGDCRNIHGHSYEFNVTLKGVALQDDNSPKNGMLMDFGDLKSIVRNHIVDRFDHAFVINEASPYRDIFEKGGQPFEKLVIVPFQPTSENLIVYFASVLQQVLPAGVRLHSLLLRETVTSYVEWFDEDNI